MSGERREAGRTQAGRKERKMWEERIREGNFIILKTIDQCSSCFT
jgi:hypothetical protein